MAGTLVLGPAPGALTVRLTRGYPWRCSLHLLRPTGPDGTPAGSPGSGPGGAWQWLPDLGHLPRLVFTHRPDASAPTTTTWTSTADPADPAVARFDRPLADVAAVLALHAASGRLVTTLAVGDLALAVGPGLAVVDAG